MAQLSFSPAPLSDPLYYLTNARLLISWSQQHYSDLLLPDEISLLKQFSELSTGAQALLIRMVMRKGELFRSDNLDYQEIENTHAAISLLASKGFVVSDAPVNSDELCQLLRKPELLSCVRQLTAEHTLKASTGKGVLTDYLIGFTSEDQLKPLSDWWPEAPFSLIRLEVMPLFDRIRLMFFGNLHQDWSEFVLGELGLQQYEQVPLTTESRAFNCRAEVDQYLVLHSIGTGLELDIPVAELIPLLPSPPVTLWLKNRYHRLLFQLGHRAERDGDTEGAIALYQQSSYPEARIRELRVKEKLPESDPTKLYQQASSCLQQFTQPELQLSFNRICQRTARKAGISFKKNKAVPLPTTRLTLEQPDNNTVEQAVINHLTTVDTQLYHVENQLFNGLFSLLFWPVLFAPVKGAFFNPFQSGPADLFRPEFLTLREELIEERLASLKTGEYHKLIRQTYRDKQGINCSLIHWPSLSENLIELSLELISADHLLTIFKRLLQDLKHHKRGLPDLICFDTAKQQYRLIEVKGPGDRLQDHQRLWLEFLQEHGVKIEVCYVEW